MDNSSKSPDPRFTGRRPDFAQQVNNYTDKLQSLRVVTDALLDGEQSKKALNMAGEIRTAMSRLRDAKAKMITEMVKEIDAVQGEIKSAHADGIEAMKLPRAELQATKQEILEIRAEFAQTSNGGPHGPLPGTPTGLEKPSDS